MKKRTAAATAFLLAISVGVTVTGCSQVSVNNKADMEQVVATVDISQSDKFETSGLNSYKEAIFTSSEIVKRDLVSYFLNVGYSYVQNGSTYKETFNNLLDGLINNAVLTQYSTLAVIDDLTKNGDAGALQKFLGFENDKDKYEYLLGGASSKDTMLAKYSTYSSLNKTIDGYEKTILEEETDYTGTDTRSIPSGADEEVDDYYPQKANGSLDYGVYTGYSGYTLADSGAYKDDALNGTTALTRKRAYNAFLNNLKRNNILTGDTQNQADILKLDYIEDEYVSQLKARVVERYYEIYEKDREEKFSDGDYIQNIYDELLRNQTDAYSDSAAFEGALDGMNDQTFILYSPDTSDAEKVNGNNCYYGFVYNILLPFSDLQSVKLSSLTSIQSADKDDNKFYNERNKLLRDIKTTDQRTAWFNGATVYAFEAEEGAEYYDVSKEGVNRNYLFFENNFKDNVRYKPLEKYDGRYSYNGNVYKNTDGSYTLRPVKLDIDDMLAEFSAYVNYVLGGDRVEYVADKEAYYGDFKKDFKVSGKDDEIDYSNFVYARGKINGLYSGEFNPSELMNKDGDAYKALSAVNELQYAYTTDTGILDKYIGYSVSAYETSYVKEFEYAAKEAIQQGVGAFTVCSGQYGWHLIYVTDVFKAGNTYNPDWSRKDTKGTFENLFYEWIKSKDLSDVSDKRRDKIINDFNKESTVEKFEKRYKDLLDLDDNQ